MAGSSAKPASSAARRAVEAGVALTLTAFGGVVAFDSVGHDIGWNANGPASGYFPFRIGLLLVATGLLIAVQTARADPGAAFTTGPGVRRVLSVFWPTLALVAGMFALGCYVPSAAYLIWMMRRHGGYAWGRATLMSIAVVALLFVSFEWWFQVPLAKGPLEAAVGLN